MQEPITTATKPGGWRRAKLVAGTLALTMGVFGAGLAVAAPAGALTALTVSSNEYTIGSVSGGVSSQAVTPATATASQSTGFSVTFVATAALSGTATTADTITLTASEAVGASPAYSNVQVIDDSAATCFQAVPNAAHGLTTDGTEILTVTLSKASSVPTPPTTNCTIAKGDKVEVDFTITAPSATGALTWTITTSQNSTGETASTTVVGQPPTLAVTPSMAFGANATYTISGLGGSTANGGSWATFTGVAADLELTSTAILFNLGGTYTVVITPSSGAVVSETATVDTVDSTNTDVILELGTAIPEGATVVVTAPGQNPAAAATDSISVEPETSAMVSVGNTETSSSVTFATAPTNVTVSASPSLAASYGTYTLNFKATTCFNKTATGCVSAPGVITLTESSSGTSFSSVNGAEVKDTTASWNVVVTPTVVSSTEITIALPTGDVVSANDLVTVIVANVQNPTTPGTVTDFNVATSGDSAGANAAAYAITASTNTGIIVTANPATTGSLATYTISNIVISSSAIAAGGTIELIASDAGTEFPNTASAYSIADATTKTGSGSVATIAYDFSGLAGATNDVQITVPNALLAGDVISITITGVWNPSDSSTADTIGLAGNVSAPAVTAPAFPTGLVSYPSGAIVNFAGTDWVFAGGHAFGVPSQTVLSGVTAVDHATILSAVAGATVPTTAPAVGTLIVVYNNPTEYVVGTDGQLHGFATEAQFLSDGFDAADVITVPNTGGLTVGVTAGSLAAAANAFATASNGALVNSSGTYYVFAGGKAFGIPTPAALTAVEATDPATALTDTIAAAQTGAAIANGTVLSLGTGVWVAYGGSLYAFKSMTQLAADGYAGTPAITVPNVGGLVTISAYTGS